MPEGKRRRREKQIQTDFAEAALEAGFALVRLAESQRGCGARRDATRALREAEAARAEGRQRSWGLSNGDARRMEALAERLHNAILAARTDPVSGAEPGRSGNLLQIPRKR